MNEEREQIERRFIATVLADPDGVFLRENAALSPEAFDCYECRHAWRAIIDAGDVESALLNPAVQKCMVGPAAISFWQDKITVWTHWLKQRGPSFMGEWRALLRSSRAAFPVVEIEPEEEVILPDTVPIVDTILEPGDKMVVASGSKSYKTWNLIQLGYCISSGEPWLGFETRPTPVLFLNFEIKPRNFWRRVFAVRRALKLKKTDSFTVWNLRGLGFSMDAHADELIARARQVRAGVIILDPVYKLLGDRNESSAGDMATLMALFDRVAVETGAAIVFAHHFAKGSAAAKDSLDRASGSGVFARDPDCILTLTRLDEAEGANTFSAAFTLREFAAIPDFAVRREHPVMVRADGVNVRNLHEPAKRQTKYSAAQLLELLPIDGVATSDWQAAAKDRLGMTRSTFYEWLPAAKKMARQVGPLWLPPVKSGRSDESGLTTPDRRTWSGPVLRDTGPTGPRPDLRKQTAASDQLPAA